MNIDIDKIAKLAKLKISEEGKQQMITQISEVIEMVEKIPHNKQYEKTTDINNKAILREDQITPSLSSEDILSNSPKTDAGCFVVPKLNR